MISVVIPSRNEQFLQKTIDDLLAKAKGEIEILVTLDGYWPDPVIKADERIVIIHRGEARGMRAGINAGVAAAKYPYILKTDAHCMFDDGFDVKLLQDMQDNWIVVPRRWRLDAEKWDIQRDSRPPIDYMFLTYPSEEAMPGAFGGPGFSGKEWHEKNNCQQLKNKLIDELMSSQGSCWFMKKDYYNELDLLDEETYGPFYKEFQEIGFKCWLSGGQIIVNKNTWYAHLHKGKTYGRGYFLDKRTLTRANESISRWMHERIWNKQTLPFSSMIERFWPVPTWDADKLADLKQKEWRPDGTVGI